MSLPEIAPRPDLFDDAETWSVDRMRTEQLSRLRAGVHRAYEGVPHYRRQLDARGVHPDDIRSLEDVRRLPFTTKADLRDNYPFGMFAVPREQCVRVHASSGTTGLPTVVGYTSGDVDLWAALMARSIR
ncbi:MAG: phenylacetate--CoA ligase, partial [Actinomycetota bacterium]|nr:phenylacetate--CoA ligase [Actinomycetota bacterium]